MRKTLEDFNFKKHNTYNINEIKDYVSDFSSQWLLDTSRQDNYDVHKDTVSYFVYRANLQWKSGQEFATKRESNDSKLIDLLEPIIKNLEEIHDGVRGMVLLIKLKAREDISIHFDSGDYLMLSKRNHIPIVTSDNVFFGVGNEKISMQAGECWEINNSRPHLVENNSDIDRIHLLIDIMPNEELGKKMIIQIIGLPGSGKTELAKALKERINAIHLNADEVRATVNSDLGFAPEDRLEQARRMGEMARLIAKQGVAPVIVDFVCPTDLTRVAFGKPDILIYMETIEESRFEDTNKMFEVPDNFDMAFISHEWDANEKATKIINQFGLHDWSAPTTLMLGRYQPWHEGHHALYKEAGKRTDQVLLGVRNTYNTSEKDPLKFDQVKEYIAKDDFMDGALVLRLPNITNIVYGRDVGYKIEQVDLGADIHAISATQKRKEMGI